MIGLMVALAAQAAGPDPSPQWQVGPANGMCRMRYLPPDGSGEFAVLLRANGDTGFYVLSQQYPHRGPKLEAAAVYRFDGGTPVETDVIWHGDVPIDGKPHMHGFEAVLDGKFLDAFAASEHFGFQVAKLVGLAFETDVSGGLATGPAAKDAVAKLRACSRALPKQKP